MERIDGKTRRYLLCQGDSVGRTTIAEGLSDLSWHGRALATLNMRTYCGICQQVGNIVPLGPRLRSTASNGEPFALSGDANLCSCRPAPIFQIPPRSIYQDISDDDWRNFGSTSNETDALQDQNGQAMPGRERSYTHWFRAMDGQTGGALPNRPFVAIVDGESHSGVSDAEGYIQFKSSREAIGDIHIVFASPRRDMQGS